IMENKNQEDLDLLLSLDEEERVLETPPGSPSAPPEESPKRRRGQADLSDFRSVPAQISDLFSDIRFVRLPTIKKDTQNKLYRPAYCIWKICSLNDNSTKKNETEKAASVFGLFNSSLRKDKMGSDFSLSVNSLKQMVKLGVSADYGVCTAKRKMEQLVPLLRQGASARFINWTHPSPYIAFILFSADSAMNHVFTHHVSFFAQNASDKFATMRSELKGGTSFRDPKSQGIYTVEPPVDRSGNKKATQAGPSTISGRSPKGSKEEHLMQKETCKRNKRKRVEKRTAVAGRGLRRTPENDMPAK
ncbi:hypothetical protein HID58_057768, partial [Brassica napus]